MPGQDHRLGRLPGSVVVRVIIYLCSQYARPPAPGAGVVVADVIWTSGENREL